MKNIIAFWLLKFERKIKRFKLKFKNSDSWFVGAIGSGLKMILNKNDPADRAFYLKEFDNALVTFIKKYVKKGDVAIDCGAQKGYVSLHLAKAAGVSGKIYAFEPDSRSLKILKKNAKINKINNIYTSANALGEKNEKVKFYLSSQLGWSTRYPNKAASETIIKKTKVNFIPLDYFYEKEKTKIKEKNLSFIKIDCEGSEEKILKGMKQILKKYSPVLWIEINSSALVEAGSSRRSIISILKKYKYKTYLPKYEWDWRQMPKVALKTLKKMPKSNLFDIVAFKK